MRFREYCESYHINIKQFSRSCDLAYNTLFQLYHKKKVDLRATSALKIIKQSHNQITLEDLCEELSEGGQGKTKQQANQ